MWPALKPEEVKLVWWRSVGDKLIGDIDGWEPHTCGSVACFGGWVALDPRFQKQGISVGASGAPWHRGTLRTTLPASSSAVSLCSMFYTRGSFGYGETLGLVSKTERFDNGKTDYQIVLDRCNWLLNNSEVLP